MTKRVPHSYAKVVCFSCPRRIHCKSRADRRMGDSFEWVKPIACARLAIAQPEARLRSCTHSAAVPWSVSRSPCTLYRAGLGLPLGSSRHLDRGPAKSGYLARCSGAAFKVGPVRLIGTRLRVLALALGDGVNAGVGDQWRYRAEQIRK
jgi:hypothetical protein